MELLSLALLVSGGFSFAAIVVSFWNIYQHLCYYTKPQRQNRIIRILFMVPIYAFHSWVSLFYLPAGKYISAIRDCYEGFVIYQFFQLLLDFLGGEERLVPVLESKPRFKHIFPFHHLQPFRPGREFLMRCKQGTLQFVFVKPFMAVLAFFLEVFEVYDEGHLQLDRGYLYITLVDNVTVTVAVYYLLLFYLVCQHELVPYGPVPKFLCIKAVVFFSFWQGVLIALLVKVGVISSRGPFGPFDVRDIATGIQNFLICLEMLAAAIAHLSAFSAHEYQPSGTLSEDEESMHSRETMPLLKGIGSALAVSDVLEETYETFLARQRDPDRRELRHFVSHRPEVLAKRREQQRAQQAADAERRARAEAALQHGGGPSPARPPPTPPLAPPASPRGRPSTRRGDRVSALSVTAPPFFSLFQLIELVDFADAFDAVISGILAPAADAGVDPRLKDAAFAAVAARMRQLLVCVKVYNKVLTSLS
eukprot:tig00020930_g16044.t1